jgi:hypothetical protein
MKSLLTDFCLYFFDDYLAIVHSLSLFLQSNTIHFSKVLTLIQVTTSALHKFQSDEYVSKVYDIVKNECMKYDIETGEVEENRESNNSVPKQPKRASQIPQFLNTSVLLSTLGKRDHFQTTPSVVNENESSRKSCSSMENKTKHVCLRQLIRCVQS